ncbi:MAG TPA: glycosyltransferase family 9 protein [Candidatus Binatia bacterium]|jgi:ADP-heptose:LPS heptosyltransferase
MQEGLAGAGAATGAPRHILIVRLGAIGDCLRVLPSVALLRRAFPAAEIGWVVSDTAAPVLEGNPLLDRVHIVRRRALKAGAWSAWKELRRAGGELAASGYDVAIDFHTRLRSGYLVRASAAPLRIGLGLRSGTEANFLFTNCHVSLDDKYENRVVRFMRLLHPLGIEPDLAPPLANLGLWIPPEIAEAASATFDEAGRPVVAVFPGTSDHRAGDRWPAERWQQVVAALGEQGVGCMVLWGPGEMDIAAAVAAASPRAVLAPPTSLVEMMALVGRFGLYLGANTAALHMAWMQQVPAVVLAGGRPWRTDRPLSPARSVMLSAGGVEPSRKLRGSAARAAVEGIRVEEVLAAARTLLAG